jgi:hypothetical protein
LTPAEKAKAQAEKIEAVRKADKKAGNSHS